MTATNGPQSKALELHVNDASPSIIARHTLILKVISSSNFDPEKEEDLGYLWNVWYDATWPESTLKRFTQDIKNLLNEPLPQNMAIPEGSHKEAVRKIWAGWLSTIKTSTVEDTLAARYISCIYLISLAA